MLNFAALILAAPATYGLEAGDASTIDTAVSAYDSALTTATDPATRTSPTIAAKDAAKASALQTCRFFAQTVRNNPAISNENKTALGITIPKTNPTPIPAPTDQPLVALRSAIPGVATLEFSVPGEDGKAKPFGVTGLEVFVAVGDVAAVDPAAATYRATVTRSPFKLDFASSDAGKTATVFGRFATRSGPGGKAQVGPFSLGESFAVI